MNDEDHTVEEPARLRVLIRPGIAERRVRVAGCRVQDQSKQHHRGTQAVERVQTRGTGR